jgi:uncharacterized protein YndB with AHSA1/START domain
MESTEQLAGPNVIVEPDGRSLVATAEVAADPERVFRALASNEITEWWVRPGVFDTREWSGDVRPGGQWRAAGMFRGEPYAIEGEYTEVDPPRTLAHTWRPVGAPPQSITATYHLEPVAGGTRITLRHGPFATPEATEGNAIGWETSLRRLEELLIAGDSGQPA